MFISVEGIDGCGKSTLVESLSQWLTEQNKENVVTREPGGTPMAEAIRSVLLSEWSEASDSNTEQLLLFAARRQHLTQVIIPALKAHKWVICDRFTDSTLAYQMDQNFALQLADKVHGNYWPDLMLWLDLSVEVASGRLHERGQLNRFDRLGEVVQQNLADRYHKLWQAFPKRIKRIDAGEDAQQVLASAKHRLKPYL